MHIYIYIYTCLPVYETNVYVYMCAWCVYMCACLYAYTDANTISFYTFVNLYKYLLIYIWFLKIYVKKSCCINKGVNKCSMAFFIIGIYIYIVYSFLRQQNPYSECIHARMACILVCAIVRTHACMYVYTGDYQLQRGYTHHKHGVAKKHGVQIFPSPNFDPWHWKHNFPKRNTRNRERKKNVENRQLQIIFPVFKFPSCRWFSMNFPSACPGLWFRPRTESMGRCSRRCKRYIS